VACGAAPAAVRRRVAHALDDAALDALRRCAAAVGVTVDSVLTAALLATISRYCAEPELLVAVSARPGVAGRLALTVDPAWRMPELVVATDRALARARSAGAGPRAEAAPPIMLRIRQGQDDGIDGDPPAGDVDFGLSTGTGVLTAEYDPDRHEDALIEGVLRGAGRLLDAAGAAPEAPLSSLPLLSDDELRAVTQQPNRTARIRHPATLITAFDRIRRRFAERTALVDAAGALTYREVARQAGRIGQRLRTAAGVGAEDLVAVYVAREDKRWVVACLGSLYADAAFLPIDPAVPTRRLAALLGDVDVSAVITDAGLRDRIPAGDWQVVDLDEREPDTGPDSAPPVVPPTDPRQLAYGMYTSGSTGTPRAVLVEHDGAMNFIESLQRLFELTPDDRLLQYASPGFDVSVFEIFCALLSGASLQMIGDDDRRSVDGLTHALNDAAITVAELPPALLELLDPDRVPMLRLVSVGGEPFSGQLATRWSRRCRFVNGYGTTETTIGVIYKECTGIWRSPPPIGRPVDNHRAYVLDDSLRPVPPGAVGELFVGGAGVARGYLGHPARTAERFLPDPFSPGARLYRTGDLARWSADGDIVFLGRRDRQVKVRGQRVELGEIEAALAELPGVAAAVAAHVDATLVGYLVREAGHPSDPAAVRRHLAERLPSYMVPGLLVETDHIPITASGKVDLAALAARHPVAATLVRPDGYRAERDQVHDDADGVVRRIATEGYAAVLPGTVVSGDTNFFAAGGDSLRAIRLLSWLREAFGVEVPMSRFFRRPTPAALAEMVERHRAGGTGQTRPPATRSVVSPGSDDADAPLSSAQQRLWFLDQLQPGDPSYNVVEVFRLRGDLDVDALRAALRELIVRHEMLRTRFVATAGVPRQVVGQEPTTDLAFSDLTGAPDDELDALLAATTAEPFDLSAGPLIRARLVRRGPADHVLAWVIHHVVADGRATEVLYSELSSLYNCARRGLPGTLPPVPLRFRDYARGQREALGGEAHREDLAYWRDRLAGVPGRPELPTDRSRPARPTGRGGTLHFDLPPETGAALAEFSARVGVTSFMTMLTAFFAMLSRYGRDKDIVVGTPFANRTRRETENLVGFLVNTVPLRADCAGDPTFAALLSQVAETTLAAGDHAEAPFEALVSELRVERDLGVNPLVQVIFQLIDAPEDHLTLDGIDVTKIPIEERAAAFDLVLEIRTDRRGRLAARLNYSTDLFHRDTVARIAGHYRRILRSALDAPDRHLSQLDMLAPDERRQLLDVFNRTVTTPVDTVTAIVERRAATSGDAVAVVDPVGELTYAELNTAANRLAHHLRSFGVDSSAIVALCLPPSADLVVAMLAVLKAGAAYLPLDLAHPTERIRLLLADCGVDVAIGHRSTRDRLPADLSHVVNLDEDHTRIRACPTHNPPGADPADLAYVLYTSGSTGRPKGVAVPHQALARLVLGCDQSPVGAEDRFLLLHPTNFDASNLEIWLPLAHGASIVVPAQRPVDPGELGAVIRGHEVTVLWLPAALAQLVVDTDPHLLSGVRQLGIGGQSPSVPHLRRLLHELPELRLLNCYGPTESTTNTTLYHVAAEPAVGAASIPIGRPVGDTRVYVVGTADEPVPIGVPGELYIGGRGLARGYVGAPAMTADRFIPDPFGPVGQRVYRTGDIVRWSPDGTLDFLGRTDDQVKIRGYRIELGEVAAVIRRHTRVRDACVVQYAQAAAAKLAAYVVCPDPDRFDVAELLRFLRRQLPEYMVPELVTPVAELPLTASGKVNRALIPKPRRAVADASSRPPATDLEKAIHALWAEVLEYDTFGIDDDFFGLGGNSYQATQVAARLRTLLGVEISVRTIFEHRRIAELAPVVASAPATADTDAPIRPRPSGTPAPLSVGQQRLWFLDQLHPGRADYNVPMHLWLHGALDVDALRAALREVLSRHEVLRSRFTLGEDRLPVQVVDDSSALELPETDLSDLPAAEARVRAEEEAARSARTPFRLDRSPLIRARLLRVAAEEHLLAIVAHHAAVDADSFRLLLAEVGTLYVAGRTGIPGTLEPLPVQYADYALWQRQHRSAVEAADLDYWRGQLTGLPTLELPTDRPRPRVPRGVGGRHRSDLIDPVGAARLASFARAHGATEFMLLLAALQATLYRFTGQEDFGIGTPVSQRSRPELASLIGFFVNTLVLRADVSGDPTFAEFLTRTRRTALAGYAHRDLPFDRLVEDLRPTRAVGRNPLFDVVFYVDDTAGVPPEFGGLATRIADVDTGTAKFDLDIAVVRTDGGLHCVVEFDADLFTTSSAARLATAYRETLRAALDDPHRPLSALDTESEPSEVLG